MKALFWLIFIGAFSFAAIQVWPVIRGILSLLTPFILGLILAYLFHPIVELVQHRWKLGRLPGILAVFACVILLLGGFFAVLVPILYGQVTNLLDALSQSATQENLDRLLSRFIEEEEKREELLLSLQEGIASLKDQIVNVFSSQPDLLKPVAKESIGVVGGALRAIASIFGWLGGIAATLTLSVVIAFYCLIEMSEIPSVIRRLLPARNREKVWGLLLQSNRAVGGFLRGQLIACAGVGILATIVLLIVGLKQYAVLIGFMAGAVNFIPYLGPAFGATPAILWALFTPELAGMGERFMHVGFIVGGFALVQAVDGFIFQPFIVGKQAALHPLAVMLALVIGAQFGVGGMILAVPVACVVKVFFLEFLWKKTEDISIDNEGE